MFHEPHRKIHEILKKHHPEGTKKARKIFSFKYPKLFLLITFIGIAYYLFSTSFASKLIDSLSNQGYHWVFISGVLTTFGFTAPFGIGVLSKIIVEDILLATLIGAMGAMIADLFIFHTIKFSFANELKTLEKTKAIQEIEKIVKKNKHVKVVHYLLYVFAGLMVMSPLPDEIGVSMLAGLTTINPIKFAIISFSLHSLAIFSILSFI
jgi:uncharacterized membrane protein YdjX (TVP38/TMEM64 family)